MQYFVTNRLPTYGEYKKLCESVGWDEIINFSVAKDSLKNSVHGVVVQDENMEVVGMGRVVGDGAIYFYIQDIVVSPQHQKKGVGKKVLNNIFAWLKKNAPRKSFIALFSTEEAKEFYHQYSLQKRDLVGLFTVKELIQDKDFTY